MDRFVSLEEAKRLTSLGRSQIYEMVRRAEFPPPYKLTARRVGFRESDIEAWIESRQRVRTKLNPTVHQSKSELR